MKPRMRYIQFKQELDDQIDIIKVGGRDTKEIVSLVIDYEINTMSEEVNSFLTEKLTAQSKDDVKERKMIMLELTKTIIDLREDPNSRQMLVRPNYIGNERLSACISLVHVLFRKGKIIMNVYQRSQNIDNFLYDQQTFFFLAKMVANTSAVDKCEINVIIGSLHKYLD